MSENQNLDAASRVKAEIEKLVQGFDAQEIARHVEEFGKKNPVGLALTSLTLGVIAGLLVRSSKKIQPHPLS